MHRYQSKEESIVANIAAGLLGEPAERQCWFPWLISTKRRRLYLDAYFPNHRLAIEYDGRQHREFIAHYHRTRDGFRRLQERDREKAALCAANGIVLVRIRDDEPRTPEHIGTRLAVQLTLPLPPSLS